MHDLEDIATRLLGQPFAELNPHAQKVARQVAARKHIARNVGDRSALPASVGQRAADAVARFGGSWIFVGLFLPMRAAIQAPVTLMSQKRQSEKERSSAEHGYEINLKAELKILLLHEKVDGLRFRSWPGAAARRRARPRAPPA